jgi:hypothetical protein
MSVDAMGFLPVAPSAVGFLCGSFMVHAFHDIHAAQVKE